MIILPTSTKTMLVTIILQIPSVWMNPCTAGMGLEGTGGYSEYLCAEKISLNISRSMPVFPNSTAGMYFLTTVIHISSCFLSSKRVAKLTTPWNRNALAISLNVFLPRLSSSKFLLSKKEANVCYLTSLTRHQAWISKHQS